MTEREQFLIGVDNSGETLPRRGGPAAGGFGVMYAAHKLERNFIGCDAAYCGGRAA